MGRNVNRSVEEINRSGGPPPNVSLPPKAPEALSNLRVRIFNGSELWHGAAVARAIFLLPLFFCIQPIAVFAQQVDGSRQAAIKTLNTDLAEANRLEALTRLEQSGGLDSNQISRSICDTAPAMRAAALRAGEAFAGKDPDLEFRLIALCNDRAAPVQLQLLKSLPKLSHPKAAVALRSLIATLQRSSDADLRSAAEAAAKAATTANP